MLEAAARSVARYPMRTTFPSWLRLGGEWRETNADGENDRELDQPHGHLGKDGWREFSRRELLAVCGRQRPAH